MKKSRATELALIKDTKLTKDEVEQGWTFCSDCDGLLINVYYHECPCIPQPPHVENKINRINEEHFKDLIKDDWSSEELQRFKDGLKHDWSSEELKKVSKRGVILDKLEDLYRASRIMRAHSEDCIFYMSKETLKLMVSELNENLTDNEPIDVDYLTEEQLVYKGCKIRLDEEVPEGAVHLAQEI